MAGLEGLVIEMRALSTKINAETNKNTQDVAIKVLETFVNITRVDTSKAISNYLVSIGSAPSFIINARHPGKRGSTQGQSSKSTIDEGTYKIRGRQIGQDIVIQNNLSYIDWLDSKDSMEARAYQAGIAKAAQIVSIK